MYRRITVLLCGLVLLTACNGMGRDDAGLLYIDLGIDELQSQLERAFPMRSCALQVACTRFSEPRLQLAEGANRLQFSSTLRIELGPLQLPGSIALSGTPRYDKQQAAFFLENLKVEQLSISGLVPELAQQLQTQGGALLQPLFDRTPIYQIDGDSLRGALLRRGLRGVTVTHDGALRASFGIDGGSDVGAVDR